jgi:hypothetical protein
MKKADNFDTTKWLVENKITTQSRLNEEYDWGISFDDILGMAIDRGLIDKESIYNPEVQMAIEGTMDQIENDDTITIEQAYQMFKDKLGSEEIPDYDNDLNENQDSSTGLITFEQLKQACIENYSEYISDMTDGNQSLDDSELDEASNIDELVNILDGMGFNGDEAYDFIFGAILKK